MRIAPAPSAGDPTRAPFRVLTVCTGNLHRSPLAEGLLTARLGRFATAFRVSSAGTAATPGEPMDPVAVALLEESGGAPSGAHARRLSTELVEAADLVLGAAAEHRDAAVRLSPVWALRRAFTLREFARLVRDDDAAGITDPVRRAAALVEGAARRRGAAAGQAGDDDVADPYGAAAEVARSSALRILESVERITAAVLGRPLQPTPTVRTGEPAERPTATD
jgi:protein-tyrosine phosphatase